MPLGTRRPITFGYRSTLSKVGRIGLTFISTKFASVLVICIDTPMFVCSGAYHYMLTTPRSSSHLLNIICFFFIICRDTRIDD